jgi:hypothetical protein
MISSLLYGLVEQVTLFFYSHFKYLIACKKKKKRKLCSSWILMRSVSETWGPYLIYIYIYISLHLATVVIGCRSICGLHHFRLFCGCSLTLSHSMVFVSWECTLLVFIFGWCSFQCVLDFRKRHSFFCFFYNM